jgi:hypothetical protein
MKNTYYQCSHYLLLCSRDVSPRKPRLPLRGLSILQSGFSLGQQTRLGSDELRSLAEQKKSLAVLVVVAELEEQGLGTPMHEGYS